MILIRLSRSRPSQGQCHFEVKVIPESNCKCLDFYPEAGDGPSTECILVHEKLDFVTFRQLAANFDWKELDCYA